MPETRLEDLVIETSDTTGVGTYSLAGPIYPYRGIVAAIGDANRAPFMVTDGAGNWEALIGTVTDAATDTLARTLILASSNAGAAVNWPAGTKTVRLFLPAYAVGALAKDVRTFTGTTAIGKNDGGVLFVFTGGANADLQLPAVATVPVGFTVYVMNASATAMPQVDASGSQAINGDPAKLDVAQQYESCALVNDGSEWKVASRWRPLVTRAQTYAGAFYL